VKKPGGKGDFGVPPDKPAIQLAVSKRIREQHPGERSESGDVQPRAGAESREAGVGGREAGPGSFSGGDLDPEISGVGYEGRGLSQAGPDEPAEIGRAESTGGSAKRGRASDRGRIHG
jgi:hypothetical protein